jgi:hypothetical protein
MRAGRIRIDHISVEAFLNYTNNQPFRLGPRPDGAAGVLGARAAYGRGRGRDRHGPRRAPSSDADRGRGAEGPTRQVFEKVGVRDTLERAVEMIGYGREPARRRGDRLSPVGWWPCMPAPSGAYVQMNGDGSATIVTGAQENGSGAVMAMPMFVAQELGIDPNDRLDPVPGHRRRTLGHGVVRIADDVQQRPRGPRGREGGSGISFSMRPPTSSRRTAKDLELADGVARG